MQQIYSVLLAASLLHASPVLASSTSGGAPHQPTKKPAAKRPAVKRKALAPPTDPTESSIRGVVQTTAGETLPGATIFIRGTYIGTATNQVGQFNLNPSFNGGALELVVSYVGYETQVIQLIQPDMALNVRLVPSATLLNETVVSASRIEENILRAPVTIDKVSGRQLDRISTPEVLAGLGMLPGVDVNSASMLFTSISTRGFNTAKSERVIQLVDYMDTALPSLNLSPGNLVGIPELDMESIEIIHGPASALYGSNALSGVVLFNSKDPFVYDGLSVRLRGGERNLMDGQVRYAKKIGERFAFKLNASGFRATDWLAQNFDASSFSANPAGSTLGYDAVNRYGETSNVYSPFQNQPGFTVNPELYGKTVYMPGFSEADLIRGDEKTRSYRVQGAVSYLVKDDLKLTVEAKRGVGTSTYQNLSRFRIKDLGTNQYRAELKDSKGFIRLFSTEDFSGSTYELSQLSRLIQNSPVSETNSMPYSQRYFVVYNQAYSQARGANLSPEQAQAAAQSAANGTQLQATDARFIALRDKIANNDQPGVGAQQNFGSFLNDISAQRSFKLGNAGTNLIVGAAYREFRLGSGGKLFADTEGKRIGNYEYGAYGQVTQALLDEHLKLAFAGRVDNFKNFAPAFSPRAAAVYSLGQNLQHNFRASFSQAFRSPTQPDQYLRSDVGNFILLGNVGDGFKGYNFTNSKGQAYTPGTSLQDFEVSIDKLRLERVSTAEVGYKGAIIPNVYVDASYFRSSYNDFIGGRLFVGNVDGSRPTFQQVNAGLASGFTNPNASPARVIYAANNNSQEVRTQGATFGLTYYMSRALNIGGNYSFNLLDKSNLPEGFLTFFNTPKHKFNILASGTVLTNLTYSVNYRWVEGHSQELPLANGQIRTYSTTDAYLGYTLPKLATTLQAGVSNAFDANNVQIIGGPQIGRLAYLGVLLNVK
ncbi:TonB-dependent receptor [Hymenobacter arizonensis]|uniref:TonB-dependent Receptor Plug Domain n=1 Tax=Hymenobacter arizonensis TaxID=1227077 RepID=A0A1I5XIZ6_HYMAR|nr:carboxypeptidase-like regulatory domain-containing protein [Hymenobacter arizonensis]SFQ31955.1 TonB-dependent Receptor Plug Domain [Hymenobacter arizonensis]